MLIKPFCRRLFLLTLLTFPLILVAQKPYLPEVEAVLKKAGENRQELETALLHYSQSKDSLKRKAMEFLIANMDLHYSADFYWTDSSGNKIEFNELDYPDFDASKKALEEIRQKYKKIKPKAYQQQDIEHMKAQMLIENVELAFEAWKSPYADKLSFEDFCEYLLPYRVSIEPLQNWRKLYQDKFSALTGNNQLKTEEVLHKAAVNFKENFNGNLVAREEPLPRLGALQLLHRREGACEDFADLEVLRLRALGIPVALNIVPYWATSSGRHFINSVLDESKKLVIYDVARKVQPVHATLKREPSKVIRATYGRQKNTLAAFEDPKNIPPGFMRMQNYVDVTGDFWEVKDLTCPLSGDESQGDIVYACVFNYLGWRPTWWAKKEGRQAVFNNMSKGVVYLPVYYRNGRNVPAGYPVAAGYQNELVLKPDTVRKHSITIAQEEDYLVFRSYKNYKLFYWDNKWNLLAEKKTDGATDTLVFDDVPKNALLLLVPEYSQRKERPFIMLEDNQRVWF